MFFPEQFLSPEKNYALIGASSSSMDHSYHLFLALEKVGCHLTPISTTETTICGVVAYPSLLSIPPVDGVIFATKDIDLSMKFLREMRDTGLHTAWFEDMPDMTTPEMKSFAGANFFDVVQDYNLLEILQRGSI